MFTHTLKSRVVLAALAMATLVVILASGVSAAQAVTTPPSITGVSIQLLEIKAAQQNDPRASVSIVDSAEPGATVERRIRVLNASDATKDVRLYTTGATVSAGTFSATDEQNALASWTTAGRSSVTLAASEAVELSITIAVPADAASGEQYAAVWAEVESAPDPATNIINSNRAGLRIYLLVGGANSPASDFTIDSLTANRSTDGNPTAQAKVTNTGGRAIELAGSIALAAGPGGLSAGPISIDSTTSLAPGESGQITVTLDASLPAGPWDATLTLTGAAVTHDRTEQLTFPAVGTVIDANASIGHDTGLLPWLLAFWLGGWPWILLAIVAIAALLIGVGIKLRARAAAAAAAAAAAVLTSPRRASRRGR